MFFSHNHRPIPSILMCCGLAVPLISCGDEGPENANSNADNNTLQSNDSTAQIELINPSVKVVDEQEDCSFDLQVSSPCYTYNLTFVLKNNSTQRRIERLDSIKLQFGRDLEIDTNYNCDMHPWTLSPNEQTSVIDLTYIPLEEGIILDDGPHLLLPCGGIDRTDKHFVEPAPFSGGDSSGKVTLTLGGILDDASSWTAQAEMNL